MTWATQYLGIPFLDRGLDRKGCDCWGLYRLIMIEQRGLMLPEWIDVPAGVDLAKLDTILAEAASASWREIPAGEEQPFDVVLMKGIVHHDEGRSMAPIHIGCVVTPGVLIQIEVGVGVTISNYRTHPRVRRRVVGFYRYSGA